MNKIDKLLSVYNKANPFVKFLSVTGAISASTTICTDIGNIISTLISEPPKIYGYLSTNDNNFTKNNMFQTTL